MDMLEESGLTTMVGKVNMDRNGALELQEKSAQASAQDTRQWLEEIKGRYDHTYPILTPRFTPSCTDELMTELGKKSRGNITFRFSLICLKISGKLHG